MKRPMVYLADAVKAKMIDNKQEVFQAILPLLQPPDPGNATAHFELSRLWMERRDIPRAIEEIRYALQRDSSNKWFYNWYANLLDVSKTRYGWLPVLWGSLPQSRKKRRRIT